MPRLIAVTSDKGGVGKSTLAMHLAGALAALDASVLLIDEDGRIGSCARWAARGERNGSPPLGFAVQAAEDVKKSRVERSDFVVMDTEGRPKRKELRRIADEADLVLVPSGVSALELEATLAAVEYLCEEAGAARHTRAVLTRVPPVGRAGEEAREDLREAGLTVCNTLVRAYAPYTRAAEAGTLVRDLPGASAQAAWEDMQALARELA